MKELTKFVVGLMSIIQLCVAYPAQIGELPNLSYDKILGDDRTYHQLDDYCVSPDSGELTIAVTIDDGCNLVGGSLRFELWTLDAQGNIINKILVPPPDERLLSVQTLQASLAPTSDGQFFVIPDKKTLVRIDRDGKILLKQNIFPTVPNHGLPSILKIIPLTFESFLLVGNDEYLKGLIIKMDKEANILWKKRLDCGRRGESFYHGFAERQDKAVVIGTSADYEDKFGLSGVSMLWILKLDSNGDIINETMFEGRMGKICKADDDSYFVIYDKFQVAGMEVWLRVIDLEFKEIRSQKLFDSGIGILDFDVVPLSNGDYLFAGEKKDLLPMICRVNGDGNEIWRYDTIKDEDRSKFHEFFAIMNQFYILSTTFHSYNNEIGISCFTPKIRVTKFLGE